MSEIKSPSKQTPIVSPTSKQNPATKTSSSSFFTVSLVGQIESALFPQFDNLYCKFSFIHGADWVVISGLEDGLTQLAKTATSVTFGQSFYSSGVTAKTCVWNFPLDISFKSTNAYGWPQLVVCVYGLDDFGRDVVRGYGSIRLPLTNGRHTLYIPTFVPLATSPLNEMLSWLTGRLPEFLDSSFVSHNKGREVTRVKSQGTIKISINVAIKDIEKFGLRLQQ